MLQNRSGFSPQSPRCKQYQTWTSWAKGPASNNSGVPQQSASAGSTPPSSAPQGPHNTGTPGGPSSPPQPGPSVGSQPQMNTAPPSTPPHLLWVIFGVKGPRPRLEAEQITVHERMDDSTFYRELKTYYRKSRGTLNLLFSFWRLGYCEVVKVRCFAKLFMSDTHNVPVQVLRT